MDRITTALLAEFSVENQIENLPEETRFEHFAAYLATSRHVADTFDTADLHTGAGGDTGIDALAILINGSLVTDSELVAELAETNGYLDVTFMVCPGRALASVRRGEDRHLRLWCQRLLPRPILSCRATRRSGKPP